jgi:hypothetical protein
MFKSMQLQNRGVPIMNNAITIPPRFLSVAFRRAAEKGYRFSVSKHDNGATRFLVYWHEDFVVDTIFFDDCQYRHILACIRAHQRGVNLGASVITVWLDT